MEQLRHSESVFPTISGGFPAIFLPLLRVSLSLLSVVFVSSVAMPTFALPAKRNMDAYIHRSVAWEQKKGAITIQTPFLHTFFHTN